MEPKPLSTPAPNAHLWQRAQRLRSPRQWAWWLLPALAFALLTGTALWLTLDDREKQDEGLRRIVADALSLESLLREHISANERELARLATELNTPGRFLPVVERAFAQPDMLQRNWLTVYLINASNAVVAQYPPSDRRAADIARGGMTAHIETPVGSDNRLVARFPLRVLLEQNIPWWVSSRYSVRFVDDFDQVLATTDQLGEIADHARYKISFDPPVSGVNLELVAREAFRPWWARLPLFLLALAPLSLIGSTWLLARQTRNVRDAEQAWRTELSWRRAMEDSITVGMRVLSMEGTLIYANPRFAEMTGFSEKELIGSTPPMPYWAEDEIDETHSRLQRVLDGDSPKNGYEVRWQRKDGNALYVMVLETPLVDASGKQLGWMASAVDVTERKLQEATERAREERMIAHARLVTIGEIASALAHELNQPLSAIVSYNAGLKNTLFARDEIEEPIRNALVQQGAQAERAGEIVRRIRHFLSRTSPQLERCDLNLIAQSACDLVRKSLTIPTAALETDVGALPVIVQADRVLLEQVVVNLIRNADEALSAGARADHAVPLIRVRVRSEKGQGTLVVDDAAAGFGELQLKQLTSPFFSTKRDGMGLGLAICRSIIEAHHGNFNAQSAVAIQSGGLGGARFALCLPLADLEIMP